MRRADAEDDRHPDPTTADRADPRTGRSCVRMLEAAARTSRPHSRGEKSNRLDVRLPQMALRTGAGCIGAQGSLTDGAGPEGVRPTSR